MYSSYTAVHWLFFFYFYCFFGWCFESTYVSLKCKRLVNRGFMRGPFLPLYGSGAIMMLLVSMPFQENLFLVYVVGCIGATVLEYVTGVAMEAIFKVRYWDYSNQRFHFQGHICLSSSLAWGVLTILMTEWMHKPVERFAMGIPLSILTVFIMIVTAIVCADFALSFKAALDLRDVLIKMEKAKQELMHVQKRLDVIIALTNEELAARKEALSESLTQRKEEWNENIEEHLEKMENRVEKIENHVDEMRERVELRVDELKGNIEDRLQGIRKLIQNGEYKRLENLREELFELKHKYMGILEERERLSRLRGFFQRDMLRAHPTMSSSKFREALEELKEKAAQRLEKDSEE
ncbi:MAG: hypothetical protein J6A94_03380 [Lachnospiraceae bacterium]|nr:hypothetical protein [Lachnospiraceae bacterium]